MKEKNLPYEFDMIDGLHGGYGKMRLVKPCKCVYDYDIDYSEPIPRLVNPRPASFCGRHYNSTASMIEKANIEHTPHKCKNESERTWHLAYAIRRLRAATFITQSEVIELKNLILSKKLSEKAIEVMALGTDYWGV